MNITMVGTGYVGLVTGTCFAEMGNKVTCVDVDSLKIDNLKKGIIPIYEPGLEEMVKENSSKSRLNFTTSLPEALETTEVVFIAVGTPQGEDGSADLQYVLKVAEEIGDYMKHKLVVVDKSTVPVGTADKVKAKIAERLEKRNENIPYFVVSNPEFLKEGAALDDFMHPDRVVIGSDDEEATEIMNELYAAFTFKNDRILTMDVRSAEMTKYAANAMLATKISFMNEIARICEAVGADVNQVRLGIGSDRRIGYSFIYPGTGYGGSCFPKDVQALVRTSEDHGYKPRIIRSVEEVNYAQKSILVDKILHHFGEDLSGLTFALWGLSFKPETDDMREAPSIVIINDLLSHGAKVNAYDPKAMHEAEEFYLKDKEVTYSPNKYDALDDSDAMLLVTEWKEFRSPDFYEMKQRLKQPLIFDGRNQYHMYNMKRMGFTYYQIGAAAIQAD